jgi:hypothetical protein
MGEVIMNVNKVGLDSISSISTRFEKEAVCMGWSSGCAGEIEAGVVFGPSASLN